MMGYKNPDKYVTHPSQAQQQGQGQIPPEIQKALQEAQQTVQELQQKLMKAEAKHDIEAAKIELEKAKLMLQEQEMKLKYHIEREKMQVASMHKVMDINQAQRQQAQQQSAERRSDG
jgi:hypothetical protein